ncbi:unnamed protein product [Mytilus coruscus]|uniref:Uncharacterized protein n=1 Tax=Mytilus coruscus TaxID=42192 RepID=A0A6J8AR16_MYTCO|nr:unnamed protein product [Mytilus coruscus]
MEGKTIEKHDSLKFYHYLCQQIGSEEVVRIRKLVLVINDIGQKYNKITSGSKGEGLDLKGSDLNIMFIDGNFKVYESESESQEYGIESHKNKQTLSHIQKYVLSLMEKEKIHTIIKSLTIYPFGFCKESSIVPQELQLEVSMIYSFFHTLSFAHFLNFLCYYHLHDLSSCRQSLQRLEQVQQRLSHCGIKVFIPETRNTVILCGIARQLMGDTFIARRALAVAAGLDKYNFTSAASRLSNLI